ncbi:MAG: nickel-dependent lactate racemase [Thermoleophilia bacterium]|nr:nickel-dependent lactate racemase [Thermoleophilia bacterium]
MRVDVPWGTGTVPVEIPEERVAGVLQPRQPESVAPLSDLMREGLKAFRSFLAAAKSPLVVLVNDGTRPTPSAAVLALLRDDLERWHSSLAHDRELFFLIATGTHRAPTPEEVETIFGADLAAVYRARIIAHDAWDTARLVSLGHTRAGTPVIVNKTLADAESVLIINSVEPHYFAGYTGGRKSVVPGVAAFETVRFNHQFAMRPGSVDLVLDGNPVHEDLTEATAMALAGKQVFSIQLVLDSNHRICYVACGDWDQTLRDAARVADEQYVLDIDAPVDIVVSVASHPMDCDLYQTNKAIQSGAYAVRPGGILIVVSRCPFGIGHNRTFFDVLSAGSSPDEVIARAGEEYQLGLHQATRIASILKRAEIWAVTNLPDQDLRSIFFLPFPDVQSAVDAALRKKGPDAKVLFLLAASITVPRVRTA